MFFSLYRCLALSAGLLLAAGVEAGIVLNTTRVIYPASDKEVSFGVHNTGSSEILLQTWLEANASQGGAAGLPFVVTPALARMAGDARQLLRIIYAGTDMPGDRESVLWLNVQEIPQVGAENALQIAIRQRIKLFFRPAGLKGDPAQAPEKLLWEVSGDDVLSVENPGSYHVSMVQIRARQGDRELLGKDSQMLAPGQRLSLPLQHRSGNAAISLSFIGINDFGGQVKYRATLTNGQAVQATQSDPR